MARSVDPCTAPDPFLRKCLPLDAALHIEAEESDLPASTLLLPDGTGQWYDPQMDTHFTQAHLHELFSFPQGTLSHLALRDEATRRGGVDSYHYIAHGRVHVCAYRSP
jgi:hypothetical protein